MTDTLVIPSPSALLSSPVEEPIRQPPQQRKRKRANADKPQTTRRAPAKSLKDQSKPKQTKSRNGCKTCKVKRLKCDERKPTCENCEKRKVQCEGYAKTFQWRSFEDQYPQKAYSQSKQQRNPPLPSQTTSSSAISSTSPTVSDSSHDVVKEFHRSPRSTTSRPIKNDAVDVQTDKGNRTCPPSIPTHFSSESLECVVPEPFNNDTSSGAVSTPADGQDSVPPNFVPVLLHDAVGEENSSMPEFHGSEDPLASLTLSIAAANRSSGDDDQGYPSIGPPGTLEDMANAAEDDVEELGRLSCTPEYPQPSPCSTVGSLLPQSLDSPAWNNFIIPRLFQRPHFSAGSPELLLSSFRSETSAIMSVRKGNTENPWVDFIYPLMSANPVLYSAVAAMASFHKIKQDPNSKYTGSLHVRSALKTLRLDPQIPTLVALATTLALAFADSWTECGPSQIDYINMCKGLVRRAIQEYDPCAPVEHQKLLTFLCKTWIYIDVIARLTSVDDDQADDCCCGEVFRLLPLGNVEAQGEIDPLMGCASSLFPLVGKVANLVRQARNSRQHISSPKMISEASQLKRELEAWEPPLHYASQVSSTGIDDYLQTAKAYRSATLLYLHQTVPEIPSRSSANLAHEVLTYLATVPVNSSAVIVQIYPLLAAGCEAVTADDRQWIMNRWDDMSARMAIGNLDSCATVVKEVWRRRDLHNSIVKRPKCLTTTTLLGERFPSDIDLEGFPHWYEPFTQGNNNRRSTFDGFQQHPQNDFEGEMARRASADADPRTGAMDPDFTVKGTLHWIGVMASWNWTVLLG